MTQLLTIRIAEMKTNISSVSIIIIVIRNVMEIIILCRKEEEKKKNCKRKIHE